MNNQQPQQINITTLTTEQLICLAGEATLNNRIQQKVYEANIDVILKELDNREKEKNKPQSIQQKIILPKLKRLGDNVNVNANLGAVTVTTGSFN